MLHGRFELDDLRANCPASPAGDERQRKSSADFGGNLTTEPAVVEEMTLRWRSIPPYTLERRSLLGGVCSGNNGTVDCGLT